MSYEKKELSKEDISKNKALNIYYSKWANICPFPLES